MPLVPFLGPLFVKWMLKALPSRFAAAWAPRVGKALALLLVGLLLWLAINAAVGAIRADARKQLLIEQAAERAAAAEIQRERERLADAVRRAALKSGAATDAAQQQEITDATNDLPDARPSDRQRARICRELQQQDRAAGRYPRTC